MDWETQDSPDSMEPERVRRSHDPLTAEILDLESKRVSMQDANWSMRWFGLVLLRIGKPVWFWTPIGLLGALLACAYLQAPAVMLLILVALAIVGWYVEYSWPEWVEDYNAALDYRIQALRQARSASHSAESRA